MLLSIADLWVYYGKVAAVQGLSMEVNEGEILTLIGPNGAGKTTLLRTVSGLKKAAKGTITYQDERIDEKPPERIVRLGIAHVPEGRKVFPYLSVYDNLILGAFVRKDLNEIRKDLEAVFRHFPVLRRRVDQLGGSLSGGEQQMLSIGRALMAKPRLLLLDEPSLGLAPKMVTEVGKIIKDINGDGVTIVLVEQNANMALKVAQRGYVIVSGKLVLSNDTEGLMKDEVVKRAYLGI